MMQHNIFRVTPDLVRHHIGSLSHSADQTGAHGWVADGVAGCALPNLLGTVGTVVFQMVTVLPLLLQQRPKCHTNWTSCVVEYKAG